MSDYSGPAPQQQNYNQSTAFAAALQRAKQIAAKINPGSTNPSEHRGKRSLEDSPEHEAKKGPGVGSMPPMGVARGLQTGPPTGGPMSNGPMSEDNKPPGAAGGGVGPPRMGLGAGPGRNSVEIMLPGPKVGLIIGKGGETIKQLQEKSGAKMVVIQDGPGQELEKPLVISGDPQKVEYAKQLVYELMAEKEMKGFNNRGGVGGRGGRSDRGGNGYDEFGGGGGDFEVLVPKAAVGVVIGKGGDMIKKIQNETGCRVQFQQARDEGPGDRRCFLSGNSKQIEMARQKIEELIDSVMQRDSGHDMGFGGGRGGRQGGGRGGGRGGFGNRGNDRNGGDFGGGGSGGWNDRGAASGGQEVSFVVPANKCGVIIGKGGETIKQINQQSGAYCELDRRSNTNQTEKTFTIKGDPDAIEMAKRIISDKIQMPITFTNLSGGGQTGMNSSMPTAYPGMTPQAYNAQSWGVNPYGQQQQWGAPQSQGAGDNNQSNVPGASAAAAVSMNPATGQPDYSLQWLEYYRSVGMHKEAEAIEQQLKAKSATAGVASMNAAGGQASMPAGNGATAAGSGGMAQANAGGQQPDYTSQWAEYYRSVGKIKEAEAIEAQLKHKAMTSGALGLGSSTGNQGSAGVPNAGGFPQAYSGYQQSGAYYGGQSQTPAPLPGGNQQNYNFSQYGYGGQPANNQQNSGDSN